MLGRPNPQSTLGVGEDFAKEMIYYKVFLYFLNFSVALTFIIVVFVYITVVKNLPNSAGDTGLSLGPGRSHMQRCN